MTSVSVSIKYEHEEIESESGVEYRNTGRVMISVQIDREGTRFDLYGKTFEPHERSEADMTVRAFSQICQYFNERNDEVATKYEAWKELGYARADYHNNSMTLEWQRLQRARVKLVELGEDLP